MLALDASVWGLGAVLFAILYAVAATAGAVRRQARRADRLEGEVVLLVERIDTLEHRAGRAEDPCPSDPAILPFLNGRSHKS